MAHMLILRSVLLDEAGFLHLCDVLVDNTTVVAQFIIHLLEILRLQARWTQTCLTLRSILGEGFTEQSLDRFSLRLNLLLDVFNVCINRLFDTVIDFLIQTCRLLGLRAHLVASGGELTSSGPTMRFLAPWLTNQKCFIVDRRWRI